MARRSACNVVARKNGRTVINLRVDNFVMCVPKVEVTSTMPIASPEITSCMQQNPLLSDALQPEPVGWYAKAKHWLEKLRPAAVALGSAIVFLIGRVGIGLRGEDLAWLMRPRCQHRDRG